MSHGTYGQFCPVAMASEVLCSRWTIVLLREIVLGTTRFNELRRGVPRMSPALLSKRLKELEAQGLVKRSRVEGEPGHFAYAPTEAARDLKPVIDAIGAWGQRWVSTEASLRNLDPDLLMWNMRRNIKTDPMPERRCVIEVIFSDQKGPKRCWWLIAEPGRDVDLCSVDPGFEVDLFLSTDLKTMTEVYMGYLSLAQAKERGRLTTTGSRQLDASMGIWLGRSALAGVQRKVA